MTSPGEPWLTPLSPHLYSNVNGFVSFLQGRAEKAQGGSFENSEINRKIAQLKNWQSFASKILEKPTKNYIDSFVLDGEPFKIFETRLSGKFVKVIYARNQKRITPNHQLQRFASEERGEDEGKSSEGIFRAVPNSDTTCIEVNAIPFGQPHVLKNGFVFDKCLRSVQKMTENREIFSSFRCEFDEHSGKIIYLYPSEKYIIKRVGKTLNSFMDQRLQREFKVQTLLTQLNHRNINNIVHYFEDDRNMISVSCSAGDVDLLDYLLKYVRDHKEGLPEHAVKKVFRGVVEGFLVAHNAGIAHRDISLENLVLNNFNTNHTFVEIIDWGHSISNYGNNLCRHEGMLGKERYMAPELVFQQGGKYDPFKADVFALGVCLFSMLVGQMPFCKVHDSRAAILKKSTTTLIDYINEKAKKKVELSDDAVDLLNKCLKWDPQERSSMEQVLNHPFLAV